MPVTIERFLDTVGSPRRQGAPDRRRDRRDACRTTSCRWSTGRWRSRWAARPCRCRRRMSAEARRILEAVHRGDGKLRTSSTVDSIRAGHHPATCTRRARVHDADARALTSDQVRRGHHAWSCRGYNVGRRHLLVQCAGALQGAAAASGRRIDGLERTIHDEPHLSPCHAPRRADRHRRRPSRRGPRPRSAAHRRPRRSARRARHRRASTAATSPARAIPGCRRTTAIATSTKSSTGTASVMDAVDAELDAGRMPILLGGDHCLGIGSITAVARYCRETGKKLRVLWLDAHADFNTHDGHAVRQRPRHAGGLPVRPRPARADPARRRRAGDQPGPDPPDRHPLGRRRREAPGARNTASTSTTCATSTRSA